MLAERRPLQRNAGEHATRTRPGEDLSVHLGIGLRRSLAAHRPRGYLAFPAQSELAAEKFACAPLVHHQHDHVGFGTANLKAHAAALDANCARRAPARPLFAATDEPFAILAAD